MEAARPPLPPSKEKPGRMSDSLQRATRVLSGRRPRLLGMALLPALLAGYFVYVHWLEPGPFYTLRYDPEMAYLMNSLAIFKGQPYTYIDHPGTPLEVVGTIAVAVTRPLLDRLSPGPLYTATFRKPELVLTTLHALLLAGTLAAVILLLRVPVHQGDRRAWLTWTAAAALFFAAFPTSAFPTLNFWSHNSLPFAAGTLLLVLVLRRMHRAPPLQATEMALYGAGAGVLTAAQLYFATWIVGLGLAFGVYGWLTRGGWRRAMVGPAAVILGSMAGFVVATQAILHRYADFFQWVTRLVLSQGRYGSGPAGITSWEVLRSNVATLWEDAAWPILATLVVLGLVVLAGVLHRRAVRSDPVWWSLAPALAVQVVVTLLIIGKHPGAIYMLAVVAVLPVVYGLSVEAIRLESLSGEWGALALNGLVLAGLVYSLGSAIALHRQTVTRAEQSETDLRRLKSEIQARTGKYSIHVLWGYGTTSPCYALRFGDIYTAGLFSRELRELCPNDWMYDVWGELAILDEGTVRLEESPEWDILVVPADFLPKNAAELGELVASDVESAFGPIVYVVSNRPRPHSAFSGGAQPPRSQWLPEGQLDVGESSAPRRGPRPLLGISFGDGSFQGRSAGGAGREGMAFKPQIRTDRAAARVLAAGLSILAGPSGCSDFKPGGAE